MLKSRFNLAQSQTEGDAVDEHLPDDVADEHRDEEHVGGEGIIEEEEKKIVFPPRILKRAEVSIRLSLLGKTAEGDG